ncbi:ribosomal-processing cysteine protease Prp [Paenibacillus sp. JDR-2]|uniref:ribosomal-processing cysteine protease Prp n=1 Tax=Paenibacillus sp. (strain JDR-2) TaxID=324057 RepID=UPI00016679FA|nr:ribosomal-processing cysteine protease Prp [Paenibacillus sp. JDR-2]ACT02344.1 protein of unknown function DUF464 [Paenibacillus sp. JDR-2]
MDNRINITDPFFQDYDQQKDIERQRAILDEEVRDPFIITFYFNAQDHDSIYGFIAKGTTGFTQYGYDIIAAGVSSLSINTINSIKQFTEDAAEIETKKNFAKCIIKGRVSKEAIILFKSLRLGMYAIQSTYGEKFITIEEVKLGKSKKIFGWLG